MSEWLLILMLSSSALSVNVTGHVFYSQQACESAGKEVANKFRDGITRFVCAKRD